MTAKERAWKAVQVVPGTGLCEVIRVIDAVGMEIALVIDEKRRLLGTVTDGDIRRGILRGLSLEEPVSKVMNPNPVTANLGATRGQLVILMKGKGIKQIPLVDSRGRVVGLELWKNFLTSDREKANPVVILAGGLGTRLRPLTKETPKPLLPVGSRPLIEVIIERLRVNGFRNILISINYRGDQIRRFLGSGVQLGVHVEYLEEDKPLGTAGPLRLAGDRLTEPFLVINGDLLTQVHFERFLEYHVDGGYDLTLGVKQYDVTVPYGVVDVNGTKVASLREKPKESFFVNAGVYGVSPDIIEFIPDARKYDMTDLIANLLRNDRAVGGFPIHEYWMDIGGHAEYERAHDDYARYFQEAELSAAIR